MSAAAADLVPAVLLVTVSGDSLVMGQFVDKQLTGTPIRLDAAAARQLAAQLLQLAAEVAP